MGLSTDKLFIDILHADTELMTAIGSRLYSTAVPVPEEQLDNVPLPYVVVTFDGLNNDAETKDNPYEGDYDQVQIGITVCAVNRERLAELTERIRRTVLSEVMWARRFMNLADREDQILNDSNEFHLKVWGDYEGMIRMIPVDWRFSAQAVQFDSLSPCFWQTLNYSCDIKNETEDEDEQEEE